MRSSQLLLSGLSSMTSEGAGGVKHDEESFECCATLRETGCLRPRPREIVFPSTITLAE